MKMISYDNQTISQIEHFDFLVNKLTIENLIHGHCTVASDWLHNDITSPFHRLYFILDGEGRLKSETEDICLLPGRIYLIPANSTWSYSCERRMEQFFIHLRVLMMKGADLFDKHRDCMILEYPIESLKKKIDELETGSLDGIISFKSFMFEIIAGFIKKYGIDLHAQMAGVDKYEDLFSFIYNNCSAELQVSDVVSFMNSSQSTVYRGLKEDTGYSIKNYIDKSLISKAVEYLLLTDHSIKEIAYLLKFKDQYYFSRFFGKHTGMPPSVYRKANRLHI